MTTPKKDPNHPDRNASAGKNHTDRPQHPDFAELADAARHTDALAESGLTVSDILSRAGIDLDSLVYLGKQRVLQMFKNNPSPNNSADLHALVAANWIDGFLAGRRHALERTAAPADGNRRKVWE